MICNIAEVEQAQKGKILIVVAQKDFQDFEYSLPRALFEKNGYSVMVASQSKGNAKGRFGLEIVVDVVLQEVVAQDYMGVCFVGGSGAVKYQGNQEVNRFVADFLRQGKVIGAICIAPTILAVGGFLKDKQATVWNGDGMQSKLLEKNGAHYINTNIVTDGQIITADGPESAQEFAEKMVSVINFIN